MELSAAISTSRCWRVAAELLLPAVPLSWARICRASLCCSSSRRNQRIVLSSGTAVLQFRHAHLRYSDTAIRRAVLLSFFPTHEEPLVQVFPTSTLRVVLRSSAIHRPNANLLDIKFCCCTASLRQIPVSQRCSTICLIRSQLLLTFVESIIR